MKTPSLKTLVSEARLSARRFPETLIYSFLAGAVALWLIGNENDVGLQRALVTLVLGIPLSFALSARAEMRDWSSRRRLTAGAALVVALLLHGASGAWQSPTEFLMRCLAFALIAHLVVAFLPYLGGRSPAGFWDYNAALFSRFVAGGFFSAVLFVGLVVALLTASHLLAFHVPDKTPLYLWVTVAFAFNTWFFLSGVPSPLPRTPSPAGYPRNLRILTQFLLVPLVTLYLLILYAYLIRIGATATWPKGTIGYLVSAFSVLGILTLLLIHPLQGRAENRWIATYAKYFHLALFPLLVLLLLGTVRRIGEYGVTERRYFLLALGLWIGFIAAYFTFGRRRDIRTVPLSLALAAAATIVGPWNAFRVSHASQLARLERLLTSKGFLVAGKAVRAETKLTVAERATIIDALRYLNDHHDGAGIREWFDAAAVDGKERYTLTGAMLDALGLPHDSGRGDATGKVPFHYKAALQPIPIGGFRYWIPFELAMHSKEKGRASLRLPDGRRIEVALAAAGDEPLTIREGGRITIVPLRRHLAALRRRVGYQRFDLPPADLVLDVAGHRLVLPYLWGAVGDDDDLRLEHVSGALLVRGQK